jgi:crotonobetainyl-CoA:carnitine CoA-transferase CaiB-like acyl-CoA transferase
VRKAPPKIGADTITLLQSIGYTQEEISALKDNGVVTWN